MDLAGVRLILLRQGQRSLEDHICEFVDLAYQTHFPDHNLISFFFFFFCSGLNEPLKTQFFGGSSSSGGHGALPVTYNIGQYHPAHCSLGATAPPEAVTATGPPEVAASATVPPEVVATATAPSEVPATATAPPEAVASATAPLELWPQRPSLNSLCPLTAPLRSRRLIFNSPCCLSRPWRPFLNPCNGNRGQL